MVTTEHKQRIHLLIRGKVQGEEARVLGLTGFVRNLPTGEVELLAEGTQPVLDQLLAWCRVGPPAAQVAEVAIRYEAATGEYPDFRVRRGDPLL